MLLLNKKDIPTYVYNQLNLKNFLNIKNTNIDILCLINIIDNTVIGYSYIYLLKQKFIYEIVYIHNLSLSDIITTLEQEKKYYTIWLCNLSNIPENDIINNGFSDPHTTNISPCGLKIDNKTICYFKRYDKKKSQSYIKNDIKFIKSNVHNKHCGAYLKITQETKEYLHHLVYKFKKSKTKKLEQIEVGGPLYIKDIIDEEDKLVHIVDINKDKCIFGKSESVNIPSSRVNFHSHPEDAYINNKVKYGWPSSSDYIGILKLQKTIYHIVATKEGIYIITLNPIFKQTDIHLKKLTKFIDKNYDIDENKKIKLKDNSYGKINSIEKYINHINSIEYKHIKEVPPSPLFIVIYKSWNNALDTIYIEYKKNDRGCVMDDDTYNYCETKFK